MPKTTSVAEGYWRSEDGLYEIQENAGVFLVSERRDDQWVTIATAKTKTEADKELNKLDKQEAEAPVLTTEDVVAVTPKG